MSKVKISSDMSNTELKQLLDISETPVVIDIKATKSDKFLAVYFIAEASFGESDRFGFNSTCILRTMHVLPTKFVNDNLKIGKPVKGTVFEVIDAKKPSYDGHKPRMAYNDDKELVPLVTKKGKPIYRTVNVVKIDKFKGHKIKKSFLANVPKEQSVAKEPLVNDDLPF